MATKKVLVCTLNWGLGHSSRCIPLIKEFLQQKAEVFIASDGKALDFLKIEFPELKFFELPGYNILYPKKGSMIRKMIFSTPRIISAIKKEHAAVEKIVAENSIDVVFSDNRYGCFSNKAYSLFMTHQINIQFPEGFKWMAPLAFIFNKKFISKYNECLIPDFEGEQNLSGNLSHPAKLKNIKYIGPLSRFNNIYHNLNQKENKNILIICSGPEPQRTIFENLITEQILNTDLKTILVKGTAEEKRSVEQKQNLQVISIASTIEMMQLIESSSIIISRPGYSSIMDIAATGKRAIFIPTPGQTEQEYLAQYFMSKKIFYSIEQNKFDLLKSITESNNYSGLQINVPASLLTNTVKTILSK